MTTFFLLLAVIAVGTWLLLVSFSAMILRFHQSRCVAFERKLSTANVTESDLQMQKRQLQRMVSEFESLAGQAPMVGKA